MESYGSLWQECLQIISQKCFRFLSLSSITFDTGFNNVLPAFETFV